MKREGRGGKEVNACLKRRVLRAGLNDGSVRECFRETLLSFMYASSLQPPPPPPPPVLTPTSFPQVRARQGVHRGGPRAAARGPGAVRGGSLRSGQVLGGRQAPRRLQEAVHQRPLQGRLPRQETPEGVSSRGGHVSPGGGWSDAAALGGGAWLGWNGGSRPFGGGGAVCLVRNGLQGFFVFVLYGFCL